MVYGSMRAENIERSKKKVTRQGSSNVTVTAESSGLKAEVVMWHDGHGEFVLIRNGVQVREFTWSPGGETLPKEG